MTEPVPDLNHGLDGALGFEFVEIGPNRVRGQGEVARIHQQPYGIVHGGAYCALIEAAASAAGALPGHQPGAWPGRSGINTTDFLRSVRTGRLVAGPLPPRALPQLWQMVATGTSTTSR